MNKKTLRSRLALILVGVLFAAMTLAMTGCGNKTTSTETSTEAVSTEEAAANELGEGNTEFAFVCVDADGNETDYTIHTDATTVGDALLALGLIAGDESDYGLYVKTVCGITADYDVDQTYWAFYIDGEYASTGVDSTDVVAGSTYTFKVEK